MSRTAVIMQPRQYGKAYRQIMAVVLHSAAKRAANPAFAEMWTAKAARATILPTDELTARPRSAPVDFTPDKRLRSITPVEIIAGLLFMAMLIDAIPVGWL